MKKETKFLFIIGLVIEVLAFFLSQTDNISFMQKLLLPEFYKSINAIHLLEKNKELVPNDIGFSEIEYLIISIVKQKFVQKSNEDIKVLKIEKERARISFGENKAREMIPIKILLSNKLILKWDLYGLKKIIDEYKKSNLLLISIIIFLIGIGVQINSFYIENKGK